MSPEAPSLNPRVVADLKRLSTSADPGFFAELIQLFFEEAARHIQIFRTTIKSRNAVELHLAAHAMQGVCGNVGAQRLFEMSLNLDEAGAAGDWRAAEAIVVSIQTELPAVQKALKQHSICPISSGEASPLRASSTVV